MDNVRFLVAVLTAFAGVVVYGEMRLAQIETQARADLRIQVEGLENKLGTETQQRREDIREVNNKLDRIIFMIQGLKK